LRVKILFADGSFPDAARLLRAQLPERAGYIEIGLPGRDRAADGPVILIPLMTRITGEVMDGIAGLTLIQQWGTGLDGVDVAAASARGIAVGNVPTGQSGGGESVAEWCVMAALALSRRLPEMTAHMRDGGAWGAPIGQTLLGRTAGIIGLGGIGQALAARLAAFGMTLLAATRTPDAALAARLGIEVMGMDGLHLLLARSDYVFLCPPLTAETRHMMNAATIGAMREGAFLINPGRGGLVDQAALLAAIDSGRLGGAGLDVFTPEPLETDSPLLARANIVTTPHIAGITDFTYGSIARHVGTLVERIESRAALAHCVNWDAVRDRIYA
jgi:phosphoglycerate dehydrogenase-like enzyme